MKKTIVNCPECKCRIDFTELYSQIRKAEMSEIGKRGAGIPRRQSEETRAKRAAHASTLARIRWEKRRKK